MRRIISLFIALVVAVTAPAWAAPQKPLIFSNGQIKGLASTDTLDPVALQHAANNTAMSALPSALGRIVRDGFAAAGDAPPLTFVATNAACTLNAGAGDGGAQVPTSDGKCWVANIPATGIDVRWYGAKCNGTTDDAATINAALSYASSSGPKIVRLEGPALCKVGSTLTVPGDVTLTGNGRDSPTGLAAGVINLNPMISLPNNFSVLRDMRIDAEAAGINASGTMISTGNTEGDLFENLYVTGGCRVFDINGNIHRLINIYSYGAQGAGCNVVNIGQNTTLGNTVDVLLDHVTVTSLNTAARADNCFVIYDAGGLFITHSDAIYCNRGTSIAPSTNQQVLWATLHDTYLGDTTGIGSLFIDTQAATAQVKGLMCISCWASSTQGAFPNITIQNTGGGLVDGLTFVGMRSMGGGGDAVDINAGSNIRFSNAQVCGYSAKGFLAASSVSDLQLTNSTIRPNCAGQSGTGNTGVSLAGSNANVTLSNLDLTSNTTWIAGTPTGNSFVNNIAPTESFMPTVASATTIALNAIYSAWTISGTTTISTINNFWNGRIVYLLPQGAVPFTTGGNICAAFTATANVMIVAQYISSLSCWSLK